MLSGERERHFDKTVSQLKNGSPAERISEGKQYSRPRITIRIEWVPEARQPFALTETVREDFSGTPRPDGFPEERFDFRRVAPMPPPFNAASAPITTS